MTDRKFLPKIGDTVYAIHKKNKDEKVNPTRIVVGKVKTYQSGKCRIDPIMTVKGSSRQEFTGQTHYLYQTADEAMDELLKISK